MKKVLLFTVFIIFIFTVSCFEETTVLSTTTTKTTTTEITTYISTAKEGETTMINGNCQLGEITVNNTETISARDLWNNSESCYNLKLENEMITRIDTSINTELISGVFLINSFKELVPSWNVLINNDSSITILVSVGNSEGFSKFYLMSSWMNTYKASFNNQEDDYARVNIDTIVTKLDNIDRFKLKVVFRGKETSETYLRNISITTKPLNEVFNDDVSFLIEKELSVPPQQQMSIPLIGSKICSPTSLQMLLNYNGHYFTPQEVASNVYDKGANIYGNWSFNASFAGGFNDLYTRVEYVNSLETLSYYIQNDIAVAMSIKTNDKNDLVGSLVAYSSGHLIVLIGFKKVGNDWYAIVNDPAEREDSLVRREYLLTELLDAFSGYTYVVSDTSLER